MNEMTINHNGERWMFRWETGCERELMIQLIDLVNHGHLGWFAVAEVAHAAGLALGRAIQASVQARSSTRPRLIAG